jgi:hypothetical protein
MICGDTALPCRNKDVYLPSGSIVSVREWCQSGTIYLMMSNKPQVSMRSRIGWMLGGRCGRFKLYSFLACLLHKLQVSISCLVMWLYVASLPVLNVRLMDICLVRSLYMSLWLSSPLFTGFLHFCTSATLIYVDASYAENNSPSDI